MKTNPFRLGAIVGLFLGLCHVFWAMLVALGCAQFIIDFVFWAHFITPPWHIEPFALGRASILVGFTFTVGSAMGIVGGWMWNRFTSAN